MIKISKVIEEPEIYETDRKMSRLKSNKSFQEDVDFQVQEKIIKGKSYKLNRNTLKN